MKKVLIAIVGLVTLVLGLSCQFSSTEKTNPKDSTYTQLDSVGANPIDSVSVIVPITDPIWKKRLSIIEANVQRIDSIKNWSNFYTKEIDVSAEGGDATYYLRDGKIEKIEVNMFGETFQERNFYYLLDNKISFVTEKHWAYNRPMYYDSTAMKENKDSATFDFSKSVITRNQFYFQNDRILYAFIAGQVDTISTSNTLKEEAKRILDLYKQIQEAGKN